MNCQRCGASLSSPAGGPPRCAYCGAVASGAAADPRVARLMEDRNQNGVPDVIEQMAAGGASPGMPLGESSFRAAPTIDLSHVPPAPRRPSPRAKELVFAYQGTQKVMLIIGVAFLAMGSLFSLIFCWGLPVDVALALAGDAANGTVISTESQQNVKVNGRHPTLIHFRYQVGSAWHEGSSSTLDSAVIKQARPGAAVPLEILPSMPDLVRVKGSTYSSFGYVPIFVLIFPLVGFFMLRSAVRSNQREIKAFVRGTPIVARVVYQGPDTSTKMNGRHPHMIRWSFDVQGKTYEGSISHMERARIDPLVAGEHVIVLHDPQSPATSTVYVA